MKRLLSTTLAGLVALFALVALTGCDSAPEAPPPPPVKYTLTVYGDGAEPLRTFRGTRGTAGEGIAYIIIDGQTEYTRVNGTFVVEPEGAVSVTKRAPDSKYKVTLYSGTTALHEWYTSYASAGEGIAYIKTGEGVDYTRVGGTFVIEPLN